MLSTVFIGIGSNIDAERNMLTCASMLKDHFADIVFSGVYLSAARDVEDQDDFLNAVGKIKTELSPEEVHTILREIENTLQKEVPYPKGPRTIDLDILLFSDITRDTETLEIPHPRMLQRRFVLEPLCELSSEWSDHLASTLDQSCEKTEISL